jgi:hypothetical protein
MTYPPPLCQTDSHQWKILLAGRLFDLVLTRKANGEKLTNEQSLCTRLALQRLSTTGRSNFTLPPDRYFSIEHDIKSLIDSATDFRVDLGVRSLCSLSASIQSALSLIRRPSTPDFKYFVLFHDSLVNNLNDWDTRF